MSDGVRLGVTIGVLICGTIGWSLGGVIGAGVGLALGLALLIVPWWRQPLWSWAGLVFRRNQPIDVEALSTVANDRSGGGVRYQDGIAVTCIQILGKPYQPTYFTGSSAAMTANTLHLGELVSVLRQSLGLRLESVSLVTWGARRRSSGDYPAVYDTLIGTPPYAGQRETWLVVRLCALTNGDALRWRPTVGTAALAATQRIAVTLRCRGIRAKVATATDITELEKRLGGGALQPHNRRWRFLRGDSGWQTSYAYPAAALNSDLLEQAWSLRADGIIQNITLFPDRTVSATVTVSTAQPPTASPSVILQTLPGRQLHARVAALCCPRPRIGGLSRGPLPGTLMVPVGPAGVLFGKTADGERLLLPLGDPGAQTRVHIAAEDSIAKRIVIRTAAAGDRVTVHTRDVQRWQSVRMSHVAVVEHPRPVAGTTVSVTDGSISPAPRPNTMISVGPPGAKPDCSADIVITQIGPHSIEITVAGRRYQVEMEFFRAENRYLTATAVDPAAVRELVD